MVKPAGSNVNSEFIERYQIELEKNPRARVFAPLSEAYRKMGLLEEARRICRFGCEANPDFAGGHVAYAKVLLDLKASAEALPHLEKAAKLSPDNLLAQNLLGETLLQLRKPKEALKSFKMVLFLDPENARAKEAVKKWEFLTADEYGEDVFSMRPIFGGAGQAVGFAGDSESATGSDRTAEPEIDLDDALEDLLTRPGIVAPPPSAVTRESKFDFEQKKARSIERAVSLADAFTVRNDLEKAFQVLEEARKLLGASPEIDRRYRLLSKRLDEVPEPIEPNTDERQMHDVEFTPVAMAAALGADRKREILESLLRRINTRRS